MIYDCNAWKDQDENRPVDLTTGHTDDGVPDSLVFPAFAVVGALVGCVFLFALAHVLARALQ